MPRSRADRSAPGGTPHGAAPFRCSVPAGLHACGTPPAGGCSCGSRAQPGPRGPWPATGVVTEVRRRLNTRQCRQHGLHHHSIRKAARRNGARVCEHSGRRGSLDAVARPHRVAISQHDFFCAARRSFHQLTGTGGYHLAWFLHPGHRNVLNVLVPKVVRWRRVCVVDKLTTAPSRSASLTHC